MGPRYSCFANLISLFRHHQLELMSPLARARAVSVIHSYLRKNARYMYFKSDVCYPFDTESEVYCRFWDDNVWNNAQAVQSACNVIGSKDYKWVDRRCYFAVSVVHSLVVT